MNINKLKYFIDKYNDCNSAFIGKNKNILKKLMNEFVKYFITNKMTLMKISQKLNMSINMLRKFILMCDKLGIIEYKRMLVNARMSRPLGRSERIIKIKKMYDKCKKYSEIGKRLNLSRERIRQILMSGKKYGLFRFTPPRRTIFLQELAKIISKDDLKKMMSTKDTIEQICKKLYINFPVSRDLLMRLSNYYGINITKYRKISIRARRCERKQRYMEEYIKLISYIRRNIKPRHLKAHKKLWRKRENAYYRLLRYWKPNTIRRKLKSIKM